MSASDRRQGFRRTRRVAIGVGCTALLTLIVTEPGGAAPGQEDVFNNGTGSATALGYLVNPTNGNLSFGVTVGESVAGHQNTAATGQARAINPGLIGLTLAGKGCDGGDPTLPAEDQPQPLIARSGEDGAAEGLTETEFGAIEKSARASTTPFAEAVTIVGATGDPTAAFISGARTISHSGVVDGNVREALARTEIGEVSLGGGVVKLQGLTWEAIHRSGAINETIGTFTIDGLLVGGQKVPLPGEGIQQLQALGDILRPLGFEVSPPVIRVEQGIVFVDPLKIAIIPSPTRDQVAAGGLSALQEARAAITEALLEADCGNAALITIADLAVGGLSGAGEIGLELGGVQATTAEIQRFEFALPPALPALPALPAPSLGSAGTPATPGRPGSSFGPSSTPTAATTPTAELATPDEIASSSANASFADERGGILAAIGAGGLLLMLGTAEGDRRKMRSAQRALPMEA